MNGVKSELQQIAEAEPELDPSGPLARGDTPAMLLNDKK